MQAVDTTATYTLFPPFSYTDHERRDHPPQWGSEAARWIAFATRRDVGDVLALGLSANQIATLGAWLSQNALLNPPALAPMKTGEFVCACGCGETFTAQYRTKRPKYRNAAHKARAYRARRRDRELSAIEAQRPRAVALQRNGKGFKVVHGTDGGSTAERGRR